MKSEKGTHRGRLRVGLGKPVVRGRRSDGVFFCNREGKIREEVRIERGEIEAGERTVINNRV